MEDVNPLASFYASVSRKLQDGSRFYPDQRMSRMEALRSYTVNNAYAAFEEDLKGSLAAGKLADITVLSRNIMTIPEDDICKLTSYTRSSAARFGTKTKRCSVAEGGSFNHP